MCQFLQVHISLVHTIHWQTEQKCLQFRLRDCPIIRVSEDPFSQCFKLVCDSWWTHRGPLQALRPFSIIAGGAPVACFGLNYSLSLS